MGKWIRRIVIVIALIVFFYSSVQLFQIWKKYRFSEVANKEAVEEFVKNQTSVPPTEETAEDSGSENETERPISHNLYVYAPLEVDFAYLTSVSSDAIGWLYCEDSVINYPIVWGRDNKFYLHHNYRGDYDECGAIFTDCSSTPGFSDHNVIIYGHHIYNKTMLGTLENWLKQEYYDEHPVMWLLTPEQDYRIDIFSCYETPGDSESFSIVRDAGDELDSYLENALENSEITTSVEIDHEAHYVVLSTCSYTFRNARTVLHGKLVPIGSAGGVPLAILNDSLGTSESESGPSFSTIDEG